MRNQRTTFGIVLLALVLQGLARAQEPTPAPKPPAEKPAAAPAPRTLVPLRLQYVISRYQGEKKVSSLPYALSLNANGGLARLRMGARVPYTNTTAGDGKAPQSYAYEQLGVGIDSSASALDGAQFRIEVSVNDTSITAGSQIQGAPSIANIPIFRNFSINSVLVLRDSQTTQLTSAADPISGEVMRVDVTLTVVK